MRFILALIAVLLTVVVGALLYQSSSPSETQIAALNDLAPSAPPPPPPPGPALSLPVIDAAASNDAPPPPPPPAAEAPRGEMLAASLPAGMRAITLTTADSASLAGHIAPGDRVDVLITHSLPLDIYNSERFSQSPPMNTKPEAAELLAANLRVLGVSASSVVLEVAVPVAQKLRLGEKIGSLSLMLRSAKDRDAKLTNHATTIEYLSTLRWQPQTAKTGDAVKVIRGVGHQAAPEKPEDSEQKDASEDNT